MKDTSEIPVSLKELDSDGGITKIWALNGKNNFRLGRGPDNDITLPYTWVSRKHTMIQVDGLGLHSIIDLGSSNGTFLNGKRVICSCPLQNGDKILLGKTKLIFFQNTEEIPVFDIEHDATLDRTVAFLQRDVVTILVCDLRNFTHLSELIGNQLISKLLQYWTKQVSRIINQHNGIVDKFIGDAVMAMWIGGSNKANIKQALMTTLEIQHFTQNMGENMPEIPFEMGIGAALNTGEAIMGNMGVDGRRDSTVIGDVVNVAFRLEEITSTSGMDLLMGGESAKYITDADSYFTVKGYSVKGKEEQILTYGCTFEELRKFIAVTAD
ncbi:MAG: adenylate/guanylate cyclase domain-containing protein [Proteobacteria bacterium]|nr:adenylate/guanylate cyclase domain-containing protein [Pseudomonadota bacterium]MBU1715950.1 adenylate/guanylate cyclase domain-containing protein [Pseudomonadota bacterium]